MYIPLGNKNIRTKIKKELRFTERFSAGRKYILIQIPAWYRAKDFLQITKKLENWLQKIEKSNPGFINKYVITDYTQKESLIVLGENITLDIQKERRKTISSKFNYNTLTLKTPLDADPEFIRKGIVRGISKAFTQKIETEIIDINSRTLKVNVKSVKLKDNFSNWGSCSSTGNINLSIRLLLVPEEVRQYVMIHELCHIKELNHSSKFWNLVEMHCPNYRDHEKWLNIHGFKYYF